MLITTTPEPVACTWGQGASPIPCDLPDVCLNGITQWGIPLPCTADNPTIEQACGRSEYQPYLDCSAYVKAPQPVTLPQTGASATVGGLGLAFVAVGAAVCAYVRRSQRRRGAVGAA